MLIIFAAISAYIALTASNKELAKLSSSSKLAQVAPGTVFSVNLTLQNSTQNVAGDSIAPPRAGTYTSSGVPLPQSNTVTNVNNCRLMYGGSEIPAQFKPLSRRGDLDDSSKPLEWVLVTFQIPSIPSNYTVECGSGISQSASSATPIGITQNDGSFLTVSTGPGVFKIAKTNPSSANSYSIFDQVTVNGQQIIAPGTNTGLQMRAKDDVSGSSFYNFQPTGFNLIESGPLRAIAEITGFFNNGLSNSLNATIRLTFFAGRAEVVQRVILENNLSGGEPYPPNQGATPNPAYFKELSMVMNPLLVGSQTVGFDGETYVAPTQDIFYTQRALPADKQKSWHNALVQTPADSSPGNLLDNFYTKTYQSGSLVAQSPQTRALGAGRISGTNGGLGVGLDYFWETNPKDLFAGQNKIGISLFPGNSQTSAEYTYEPYFRTNVLGGTSDPNWNNSSQLSQSVDPETINLATPSDTVNTTANHVLAGGDKFWHDIYLVFSASPLTQSELSNTILALKYPIIATPSDTEYLSNNIGSYPVPLPPKRNWSSAASNVPANLQTAFNRAEQFIKVQVDQSAVSSGLGASILRSCTNYFEVDGALFGGNPAWGIRYAGTHTWASGDSDNNHYGIHEFGHFLRDPSDYRYLDFARLRERDALTLGTSHTFGSATAERRMYENGYQRRNFYAEAHLWYESDSAFYLLTGDLDAFKTLTTHANNVAQASTPATYINNGGERIEGQGKLALLAIAAKLTKKPLYIGAITSHLNALLTGEQNSINNGCLPGTFPNAIVTGGIASCETKPFMHEQLMSGAMLAYRAASLNNSALLQLFGRMAAFEAQHGLTGGTGPANSYSPLEQIYIHNSTGTSGTPSQVDAMNLAAALAYYQELTGDTQYLSLLTQLFDEGTKWGYNDPNVPVDKNSAASYFAQTCRSSQYPGTEDKTRGKVQITLYPVMNFLAHYYDGGGSPPPPPPVNPPNAPSGLSGNSPSTTQINLSWTDNSSDETGFKVERRLLSGGTFSQIALTGANATSYGDTGLSASTAYEYRVRATNNAGDSGYSNNASATTQSPPTIPNAPSNLQLSASNPTTVILLWTDNASNEDGFIIRRSPTLNGTYVEIPINPPANTTSYTDTGLTPNTTYFYKVAAFNTVGVSAYTNPVSITTPNNNPTPPPENPTGLSASALNPTTVNLVWNDVSATEQGFIIERRLSGGAFSQLVTRPPDTVTYADTSVLPSTSYDYRLLAYNLGGNSGYSNIASVTTPATPPPATIPAQPSGLTATAVNSNAISIAWADNSNNETGFKIERRVGAGNFSEIAISPANSTSYFDSGRTAGTLYTYRVRATNAVGDSPYSNTASAVTPQSGSGGGGIIQSGNPPATPTALTASPINPNTLRLSWQFDSAGLSASELATTRVVVERLIGGNFVQVVNLSYTIHTFDDSPLTPGTSYTYRAVAYNSADTSSYSNQATAVTPSSPSGGGGSGPGGNPPTPPIVPPPIPPFIPVTPPIQPPPPPPSQTAYGTPSNLVATPMAPHRITLNWTDNANNESGFIIERSLVGPTSGWVLADTIPGNSIAWNDLNVITDVQHYYRILAFAGGSVSDYSNIASAVTNTNTVPPIPVAPARPFNLKAETLSDARVRITWEHADRAHIDGFKVEQSFDGLNFTQADSFARRDYWYRLFAPKYFADRYPFTVYYRLRAYNAGGDSSYSETASTVVTQNATPPPSATFTTLLYRGISGGEVTSLQSCLKNEGLFLGTPTGYFGRFTEISVKSFQARYGIVSSGTPFSTGYGLVGGRTRAKLNSVCSR